MVMRVCARDNLCRRSRLYPRFPPFGVPGGLCTTQGRPCAQQRVRRAEV